MICPTALSSSSHEPPTLQVLNSDPTPSSGEEDASISPTSSAPFRFPFLDHVFAKIDTFYKDPCFAFWYLFWEDFYFQNGEVLAFLQEYTSSRMVQLSKRQIHNLERDPSRDLKTFVKLTKMEKKHEFVVEREKRLMQQCGKVKGVHKLVVSKRWTSSV